MIVGTGDGSSSPQTPRTADTPPGGCAPQALWVELSMAAAAAAAAAGRRRAAALLAGEAAGLLLVRGEAGAAAAAAGAQLRPALAEGWDGLAAAAAGRTRARGRRLPGTPPARRTRTAPSGAVGACRPGGARPPAACVGGCLACDVGQVSVCGEGLRQPALAVSRRRAPMGVGARARAPACRPA